ncbi:hypothetical protein EDB87DRAFT_1828576 [Lactarius vividus]|nr:hypothetical protein EDB87DRAFT_1828576 [Lactarius vividus]
MSSLPPPLREQIRVPRFPHASPKNVTTLISFILLLMSFVRLRTALRLIYHRLNEIDVKIDVLWYSIEMSQPFPYRHPHQNLLHPLNRRSAFPSDSPPNTPNHALASGLLFSLRSSTGLSPSPRVHTRGSLTGSRIRECHSILLPFAIFLFAYSLPIADFATPLSPHIALDFLDERETFLTSNAKVEIAAALSELVQALNYLGPHEYSSSVSGFVLEFLAACGIRDVNVSTVAWPPDSGFPLKAGRPSGAHSRITLVPFVDLRQNDDVAGTADEAMTILKEHGKTQPKLTRGQEPAAAAVFELMEYIDDSTNIRLDLILVSPLCRLFPLFSSDARIELVSNLALSEADKAIEASRVLSFKGQNDPAYAISAEAVTLFRSASVDHPVFSFLHVHALSIHSYLLSKANRKNESYWTIREAVELRQNLQSFAPFAMRQQLAGALYELAKFRCKDADRRTLRIELQIAETSVSMFREVSPLDYVSLAHGLYLYADWMLELNNNHDAATYAEKSTYALDLIFSLSLASSLLACMEWSEDALEYAKQAVEVQHERSDDGDTQYAKDLRQLLMDVVLRSMEIGRREDAFPWIQELHQLGLGMAEDSESIKGQLLRR